MKYKIASRLLCGAVASATWFGLLAPVHADDPIYNEQFATDNILTEPVGEIEFPKMEAIDEMPVIVVARNGYDSPGGIASQAVDDRRSASGNEKVETIRERFDDGSVKVEREVTLDSDGNYVNHGSFRQYSSDDQVIAQGKFDMGQRTGTWTRVYQTGEAKVFAAYPYREFEGPFVSTAEFVNGELSGVWNITDAQARKVSEIPFRDGLRHGKVVWNHPAGPRMFEASYELGVLEGSMIEYDERGQKISENRFHDGRRVESEIQHFENGQIKSTYIYLSAEQKLQDRDDWWNAKPAVYESAGRRLKHGEFAEYHSNGQKKSTGKYERGQLTGEFMSWFENGGHETRGDYAAGMPTGPWTWWHQNGMRRAHGSYTQGNPVGQWNSWTPDGKLAKRQTYNYGSQDAIVTDDHNSDSVLTNSSAFRDVSR